MPNRKSVFLKLNFSRPMVSTTKFCTCSCIGKWYLGSAYVVSATSVTRPRSAASAGSARIAGQHRQSPWCSVGTSPAGSNRIIAAPGQWCASRNVTLTPRMHVGVLSATGRSRSHATLSSWCTRRAVTGVQ